MINPQEKNHDVLIIKNGSPLKLLFISESSSMIPKAVCQDNSNNIHILPVNQSLEKALCAESSLGEAGKLSFPPARLMVEYLGNGSYDVAGISIGSKVVFLSDSDENLKIDSRNDLYDYESVGGVLV